MRAIICLGLLGLYVAVNPAAAQGNGHLPNAAPLKTMERAHAYHLTNMSSHLIVAAHIKMSDGSERDLTWDKPVQPRQGREIAPGDGGRHLIRLLNRIGRDAVEILGKHRQAEDQSHQAAEQSQAEA